MVGWLGWWWLVGGFLPSIVSSLTSENVLRSCRFECSATSVHRPLSSLLEQCSEVVPPGWLTHIHRALTKVAGQKNHKHHFDPDRAVLWSQYWCRHLWCPICYKGLDLHFSSEYSATLVFSQWERPALAHPASRDGFLARSLRLRQTVLKTLSPECTKPYGRD